MLVLDTYHDPRRDWSSFLWLEFLASSTYKAWYVYFNLSKRTPKFAIHCSTFNGRFCLNIFLSEITDVLDDNEGRSCTLYARVPNFPLKLVFLFNPFQQALVAVNVFYRQSWRFNRKFHHVVWNEWRPEYKIKLLEFPNKWHYFVIATIINK